MSLSLSLSTAHPPGPFGPRHAFSVIPTSELKRSSVALTSTAARLRRAGGPSRVGGSLLDIPPPPPAHPPSERHVGLHSPRLSERRG